VIFPEGRIREIAQYCETDVVNTYRVWLRYELFRGRLRESEHQASESSLADFIAARANTITRVKRRGRRLVLTSRKLSVILRGPPPASGTLSFGGCL
jgi:hypothetical protein